MLRGVLKYLLLRCVHVEGMVEGRLIPASVRELFCVSYALFPRMTREPQERPARVERETM